MKYVSELIEGLPIEETFGDVSKIVEDLKYDSRLVAPNDAFIAIRGLNYDGHQFVKQAYDKGCRIFVVEKNPGALADAVIIKVGNTRQLLPQLAKRFFDYAVEKLKIIGITGTNGKTTCAYLLHSILSQAHWKPGLITTIEYIIKDKHITAQRTTPESPDLHRLFLEMEKSRLKSAVMEVSSHALSLHRTDGIPFTAAVFTNMGHDHLDFHGNMENYFLAKKKLFEGLNENNRAVLNLDDPYTPRIMKDTEAEVFTYSYSNPEATVSLRSYQAAPERLWVSLHVPAGTLEFNTTLMGRFNLYNLLAAVATAVSLGLQDEFIIDGIESLKSIPGRSERYNLPNGAGVVIDYAHTPEALRLILQALLELTPQKLIVVFGCGGNRDVEKRPVMGKIAEDYADVILLTNDNPRSEDPAKIIARIKEGIFDQSKVTIILDRKEAIMTALAMADANDLVLIAGKGHENYQEFADRRVHFDDREVVQGFIGQKN